MIRGPENQIYAEAATVVDVDAPGCTFQFVSYRGDSARRQSIAPGVMTPDSVVIHERKVLESAGLDAQLETVLVRLSGATIEKSEQGIVLHGAGGHWLFSDPISLRTGEEYDEVFRSWETLSSAAGFDPADVFRAWLYPDDIRADYRALNHARSRAFARWTAYPAAAPPASTGVGVRQPAGQRASARFWAYRSNEPGGRKQAVRSPRQCEPANYGVLFSRAMAVPFLGTGRKLLTISGTASISPEGETLHNGDALAQLDESLRVIAALLDSRQASFRDVVQAVLYCPLEMAPDLYLRAARLGFPVDRMIVQPGILCRPDLACEIEAMAVIGA